MFRFFLIFLFSFQLLGANAALDRANQWLAKQETKSVLKAYHEFKNIRINSIMQSDKNLHIQALQGIIKSGKLLHIDIQKYMLELEELTGKVPVISQEKMVTHTSPPVNLLKSARWRYGTLILSFEYLLKESHVNYFVLDRKFNNRYRYIFDISADAEHPIKISKADLDDLRLNSSDQGKMRLVLESKKSLPIQYRREGKDLIITLGKSEKHHSNSADIKVVNKSNYEKKQYTVVIDPGHGGKDPGALGYRKYREKVIVFQIAQKVVKELKSRGYKVYMTRHNDSYIPLRKRTAFANDRKADLFISIHANSVPKRKGYQRHQGVETYYLSPAKGERAKKVAATENSEEMEDMNYFGKQNFLSLLNTQKILASNKLAIDIQRGMLSQLRKRYKVKDAGVRKGPFWILVGAQMPAVLVEVGFVTSPKEARNLINATYQRSLAEGLAVGVENYFTYNP